MRQQRACMLARPVSVHFAHDSRLAVACGWLQRVAAASAGTVLLLQPEPCSSEAAAEALKATTLISLRALQLTQVPSSLSFNTLLSPLHLAATAWHHISKCCSSSSSIHMPNMKQQCSRSGDSTAAAAAAAAGAAAAMRVVVQVPQLPRDDDLLGFLHSTTASVSKVQGARLLSQRMLDRWGFRVCNKYIC
jgi:hypothetical protein